jgi:hypothetical protein
MGLVLVRLKEPESPEPLRPEVEQQSHLEQGRAQVVEQLPRRRGVEPLGRLHFDDHLFVDDEIQPLSRELCTLVEDSRCILAGNLVSTLDQFALERLDIDVLEKAVAECVVDLEPGADDVVRERVILVVANDRKIIWKNE